MPDTTIIQILIQSGAIGIAFYLIYVNRKINNGRMAQLLDILAKNGEAWNRNTEIMGKFSEKLDELIRRK